MTFLESGLHFNFDVSSWSVLKYDNHPFFITLSGAGLKGVDFVGINNEQQLVFFEIKNFRTNNNHTQNDFLIFKDEDHFLQQILEKAEDTIMAINVIKKYLNRKVWYRFYLKIGAYLPTHFFLGKDWFLWHQIYQLWSAEGLKTFVLWLEIEEKYVEKYNETFRQNLGAKLDSKFKKLKIVPILASCQNPVFENCLKVKKDT